MAAPLAPGRVVVAAPAARPTFDSVKWEKMSKITSKQMETITAINKLSQERPIPLKFVGSTTTDQNGTTPSDPNANIDNLYQFHDWYSTLEAESSQDSAHLEFLDKLKAFRAWTDEIIQHTEGAIGFVTEIESQHSSVTTKTAELHRSCQELVKQEVQLVKYADSVSKKLAYFNELDQITKKFYSQNISVLEDRFLPLLKRLDECIEFIDNNSSYKEAEIYLVKFRLIQNRAMTLIKNHVVASLKATTNQILAQIESAPNPLEHKDAVYFIKYKALAQKLKALCHEIENRSAVKEYAALLEDCQYCYLQQRRSLLLNIVYNHTRTLATLPELKDMVTNGCTYMLDVCHQETMLFQDFFKNPSAGLQNLLEEFATILYEILRPIYIQVRVIDVLCGVVELLRSILDQINQKGPTVIAFKPLAMRMLEDIQERLTYLAQTYIRDEIHSYQPTREDLDYPNKLTTAVSLSPTIVPEVEFPPSPAIVPDVNPSLTPRSLFPSTPLTASTLLGASTPLGESSALTASGDLTKSAKASVDNSLRALLQISMKNIYATCYPTLQRTITLLTKMYLAVAMKVFQGLAHEAVSACTDTLLAAGRMINAQKGQIDSLLFVIKHLLILLSQLTYFDISFAVIEKQVDFSQFKHSIRKLLTGQADGSLFSLSFQNPLLSVIQSPQVLDSQIDTRTELEKNYFSTVDSFVNHVAKFTVAPITAFMAQVDQFLNAKNAPVGAAAHIANQPFLRPDVLGEALLQLDNNFYKWLGGPTGIVAQMFLYLPHADVTNLLLLIRAKITDTIDQMRTLMNTHYATHTHLQIIDSKTLSGLFESWWTQQHELHKTNAIMPSSNNNNNPSSSSNNLTVTIPSSSTPALANDLIQPSSSIPSADAAPKLPFASSQLNLQEQNTPLLPNTNGITNNSPSNSPNNSQFSLATTQQITAPSPVVPHTPTVSTPIKSTPPHTTPTTPVPTLPTTPSAPSAPTTPTPAAPATPATPATPSQRTKGSIISL